MNRPILAALSFCLVLGTVPSAAQAPYCASTTAAGSVYDCVSSEWISNVTIGSLNNSSPCVGIPSYEDFTSLAGPTLSQLALTPISVTVTQWFSMTDTVTVFCDWNSNNVLNNPGEFVTLIQGPSGGSGSTVVYTGNIIPPIGAAAATRMRVKLVWGSSIDPCSPYAYGNTEDYNVSTAPPSGLVGIGAATPAVVAQGSSTLLTVAVSATAPPSPPTGVSVTGNLNSIGGAASQAFYDDATHGDLVAGDLTFSYSHLVPATTLPAYYSVGWTAIDSVPRTTNGVINLQVVPFNDACGSAAVVALGVNGPYSNQGATNSGGVGSCAVGYKDVWFSFNAPCTGNLTVSTPCVGLDTVLSAYGSCGGPELACNDQDPSGCGSGSSITFAATAGSTYKIRVASWSAMTTGSFTVTVSYGAMMLAFSSPLGAGSIQFDIDNGPLAGSYFLAVTFFAGAFPNGWLYGLDIPLAELNVLIMTGPPFMGPFDACGAFTTGPVGGVGALSGTPFYAVALGLAAGATWPSNASAAVTYTIP